MMPVITIVILVFTAIVILILAHVCMVEWVFRRGLRNNNNDGPTSLADRTSTGNTSMSKDDVDKLPSFDFDTSSKDNKIGSPMNCAVCLENFKDGEKCRQLPVCSHSFHAECVDSWLVKMPSCPICRTRADSGRFDGDQILVSSTSNTASGHFSDFSLSNMESQTGTESSRFSDDSRSEPGHGPTGRSMDGRADSIV